MLLQLLVLISITSVPKNSKYQLFCNEVSLSSSFPALEVLVWGHWAAHTQLGRTAVIGSWRRETNSAKSFPLFHNRNVIWRDHIINSSCENGYRQRLESQGVYCAKSKVVWRWALFDEEWYGGADSWRTCLGILLSTAVCSCWREGNQASSVLCFWKWFTSGHLTV